MCEDAGEIQFAQLLGTNTDVLKGEGARKGNRSHSTLILINIFLDVSRTIELCLW